MRPRVSIHEDRKAEAWEESDSVHVSLYIVVILELVSLNFSRFLRYIGKNKGLFSFSNKLRFIVTSIRAKFDCFYRSWPVTVGEGSSSLDLPQPTLLLSAPQEALRQVTLERGDDGLGFSIVGGFGSNLGDLPIYVKSVFERGAASREGSLRRGDQILQVNGQSLAHMTHQQAVAVLKEAKGSVVLTILPSK